MWLIEAEDNEDAQDTTDEATEFLTSSLEAKKRGRSNRIHKMFFGLPKH
jgi:hypothetical protein